MTGAVGRPDASACRSIVNPIHLAGGARRLTQDDYVAGFDAFAVVLLHDYGDIGRVGFEFAERAEFPSISENRDVRDSSDHCSTN
jgi:hypothetical protein